MQARLKVLLLELNIPDCVLIPFEIKIANIEIDLQD